MIMGGVGQSDSPGNEQRDYWSTAASDSPGSRNLAGIQDPVIDELIELVIEAPTREELIARTKALDRVLLWGHYVIPAWHLQNDRILFWNKFSYPPVFPKNGTSRTYWWYDEQKATALAALLPDSRVTLADEQEGAQPFDNRKLLGLSFFLFLIVAAWFAFRVGGSSRNERRAVIES